MRGLALALCLFAGAFSSPPASAAELRSIPMEKGLPVEIRAAVFWVAVESFDENAGTFEATTDLRLTWEDPRLRYPREEGINGYKEYRISAAEEMIGRIWTPALKILNRIGDPSLSERRLRIYPDGTVELITRTTASHKTPIDVAKFPFDHQPLEIEVGVQESTIEEVELIFRQDDIDFSKASREIAIRDWTAGLVNLRKELVKGWNGDRYAKIVSRLDVRRNPGSSVSTIFIPLFASLLIPFMVTWMNTARDDGGFEIEAFELANVVIGGLFAIIALSFTIGAAYPAVAADDNTVTRLIALNYVALAVGAIITVVFYRYNWMARRIAPAVQVETFRFLTWAIPVGFLATGLAFIFASAA